MLFPEVRKSMDYGLFLKLVEEELDYLWQNDLEFEYEQVKAAGACAVLVDWIRSQPEEE